MDYYGRPPYGYSQNKPPNDAYYQTERPPPQPLAQPPILSEDENPGDSYSGLAGWWIESEGIEHRVIQTDIARYLGNDATVRRGDRDGVPGYYYNAYRPFTSAMVVTLKAESARWLAEKERSVRRPRDDHYHQSNTFRTRATAFNSNPGEVGLSETEPPIAPRRRSPEELYANALTEYESIEPAPNTGYSSAERTESDYANSRPVEYQRHDQRIPYSYGPGPGEYPPPPPAPYYRHSGAPGRAAPPDSVGLTAPRAYQYNYDAPQPMARPHDPAGGSNPSYHQPAPYGGGYGAPAPPPTTDHPPVQYYPYSDGYFRRPE